jgi:hypothetical protein
MVSLSLLWPHVRTGKIANGALITPPNRPIIDWPVTSPLPGPATAGHPRRVYPYNLN